MGSILGLFSSSAAMWLVIVVFIAGVVIMWKLRNLFSTKNEVHTSTLLTAVKKVNELVTLRSHFQEVIDEKKKTDFILTTSDSKILIVATGEITFRFDMSRAKIKTDEGSNHAEITLPPLDMKSTIDVNNVRVYDSTRGIWDFVADTITFSNTFDYNAVREIIREKRDEITKNAVHEWHLDEKARENARLVLENLASAFGYTSTISFSD